MPRFAFASLCAVLLLSPACFSDTDTIETTDSTTDGNADAGEDEEGADAATAEDTSTQDTGTETGGAETNCEDYCSFIEVCDTDFPQYSTAGPCQSVCDHIPPGTPGDATGNTVACRTFYATQAGEGGADQESFCRNAGPSGNGICGGFCESFCAIAIEACTGANAVFPSILDCTMDCMTWDDTVAYDANAAMADTYACRLKHLTYATLDDTNAGIHCSHIGNASPVCVDMP